MVLAVDAREVDGNSMAAISLEHFQRAVLHVFELDCIFSFALPYSLSLQVHAFIVRVAFYILVQLYVL